MLPGDHDGRHHTNCCAYHHLNKVIDEHILVRIERNQYKHQDRHANNEAANRCAYDLDSSNDVQAVPADQCVQPVVQRRIL